MPKVAKSTRIVKSAMDDWLKAARELHDTAKKQYKIVRKHLSKNQDTFSADEKEKISTLLGMYTV